MARGLFDYINGTMESPMFLAGAGLVSGEGFGGAMQGMRMGMAAQDRRMQMAELDRQKAAYDELLANLPQGIPMGYAALARAAGPDRGLGILASGMPKARDPLDEAYKRAQINKMNRPERVHVGSSIVELGPNGPQELYRAQSPIEQFVADKLRGMRAPQAAPQASPGQVIPQSYQGGSGIPGLQTVADETAPQPPAAPDLVDTPFGRMPRNEARDLGSTMLLDPRYATAGKAILDTVEGPNQGQMGRAAQNQLEERAINNAAMLSRLNDISQRFDPQFLEIPKRMQMLGASWSAKAGAKISPAQQRELSRYASFRSASVNNLNTILKELSGAAVTPQEYERLKNDVPQAGTGVFDGDDPVSFKAKLDRAGQTARAAVARYNFMRSKGLNFDRNSLDQFLSLDDVPAAIDRRGAEIESQLRKSGADPNTIDQQVRRKLKQEFGI